VNRFKGLRDIVENGFCMSCGLCTGCAPDGVVTMAWSDNGQLRPQLSRELSQGEDAAVLRLCPGVNQTGPFDGTRSDLDYVWGELRRVAMAWSADPGTRLRSSTGGVMTSVNRYMLESGRAAFILQVRGSDTRAEESEPVLVRDPAELLTGSQSRYGSSAPLKAIQNALQLGEPFAVSLKPCDIAGIRNLQREDERARKLIVFTQTMVCGSVPSMHDTMAVIRRNGGDPEREPLAALRWRGNGCPGMFVATMADGREVTNTYNDLWVDNPWTTQFRCKICPDAIGMQADFVSADSWPNAIADGESEGSNLVMARTEVGAEVLAECERKGYLHVVEAGREVLDDTQPHQVRLRRSFGARLAGALVAGVPVPNFNGLAEDITAAELTPEDLANVFKGTIERVRAGQSDERVAPEDWQNP